MKKIIAVVLVLAMAVGLVACSNGAKNENGSNESAAPTVEMPAAADFLATVRETYADDTPKLMQLSEDEMRDFYGLDPALLEDYVCAIPMMNVHATEIFIGKPAEGKEQEVKAALDTRRETLEAIWSSYLPEQYELVQNYKQVENGGYILFVVHTDAEAIANDFTSIGK